MTDKLDYLGRPMACNPENVDRLVAITLRPFDKQPTTDVVAVLETILAGIVFRHARDRADSHVAVDRIADDMKKYLNACFATRDQRKDQVGHA